MAVNGMSLHVGVNRVDPGKYENFDQELRGCAFDARDMHAIAINRGFLAETLLESAATHDAVVRGVRKAAEDLVAGDFFLLTYSGHGSHVPDTNDDEANGEDETWCLFDEQLLDDELFGLLAEFRADVRILVIADCCYSGNVGASLLLNATRRRERSRRKPRFRVLPYAVAASLAEKQSARFEEIQRQFPRGRNVEVKASVILLSACKEVQLAEDGPDNGVFTRALKAIWGGGSFTKGYEDFHRAIAARLGSIPVSQIPVIRPLGSSNAGFLAQQPFTK